MAIHNIQESNALLLYRVGPVFVCSPTMPVEAVMMPPKLTVPPGANEAEPGVFKSIHGMVRLVDLRVRFGVNKEDITHPGKIVVAEVEGGRAGFWVDEIEDVISFPEKGWAQVPAYIPKNIFSRTLLQGENIRLYADFEQLDKLKKTGYLRKYIEQIKQAEQLEIEKSIDENIKPIENVVSEIITEKSAVEKIVNEESVEEKNHIEPTVLHSHETKDEAKNETKLISSPLNRLSEKNIQKDLTRESNKKNKVEKANDDYNFTKADHEVVKKPKESESLITKRPNKIISDGNNKKEESDVYLIFGMIALLIIAIIYFVFDSFKVETVGREIAENNKNITIKPILSKEPSSLTTKNIDIGKGKYADKKADKKIDKSESKSNSNSKVIDNAVINEETKGSEVDRSAVDISKNKEGMLIIINEYDEDPEIDNMKYNEPSIHAVKDDYSLIKENEKPIEDESSKLSQNVDEVSVEINTEVSAEEETVAPGVVEAIQKKAEKEKIVVNKVLSKKFIHKVVKGDTLWFIAKRYVHNPWRYPELAKLSNIKNPNLIYPGDRVTIIINYR